MKKNLKDKSKNISGKRILLVCAFFFFGYIMLIGRLFFIQIIDHAFYVTKGEENRRGIVTLQPERGIIYDTNGNILAMSATSETLVAEPKKITNPGKAAELLGKVLHKDIKELTVKLSSKKDAVFVARQLDDNLVANLKKINIMGRTLEKAGFYFVPETKRFYPKKQLASQIIGFAGKDGKGLEGIEYQFEKQLTGTPGKIEGDRFPGAGLIPGTVTKVVPRKNGCDIYLTIDDMVQYIAEKELAETAKTSHIKAGTIIVVKPNTGEIIAMASYPSYDPNNYNVSSAENRKNLAVSMNYEPGSTYKIVTAAAALQERVVTPQSHFYCGGVIKVPGGKIRCPDANGHGSESFTNVIENSCNVGFVNVGLNRLGKQRMFEYAKAFGFGQKTGINIAGEESGIVRSEKSAISLDIATMSIGQGIAVTPIQIAMAASAVANGGELKKPIIVKEIRDHVSNRLISKTQPETIRRVISPDVASELRTMLEDVVEEGTGKSAYVGEYRAAGKTGTAQKVSPNGGYMKGKYVASFVGFAPADNPKVVVLVVLDEPVGRYYGGEVAAPVFADVLRAALGRLGVRPDEALINKGGSAYNKVPAVDGMLVTDAARSLARAGIEWEKTGNGKVVIGQFPLAGQLTEKGKKAILFTNEPLTDAKKVKIIKKTSDSAIIVPNFTGQTMRQAAKLARSLGIAMIPSGSGIAVGQNVAPGTAVESGDSVGVGFRP